jgi:hypothetical protein
MGTLGDALYRCAKGANAGSLAVTWGSPANDAVRDIYEKIASATNTDSIRTFSTPTLLLYNYANALWTRLRKKRAGSATTTIIGRRNGEAA